MKVAITTSGNGLDAPMDSRFGRCAGFLVYDMLDGSISTVDNLQNLNSAQGAGIQSAETISRLGVSALITGHCGPKAFRVLQAAGIKVYLTNVGTVAEALELYRADKLALQVSADVEGHWE